MYIHVTSVNYAVLILFTAYHTDTVHITICILQIVWGGKTLRFLWIDQYPQSFSSEIACSIDLGIQDYRPTVNVL